MPPADAGSGLIFVENEGLTAFATIMSPTFVGSEIPLAIASPIPDLSGMDLSIKTGRPSPYTERGLSLPLVWLHFTGEVLPEMTFILSSLVIAFISSPV